MIKPTRNLLIALLAFLLGFFVLLSWLMTSTLLEAKAQKEREVATTLENLVVLLDHDISSAAEKVDLSLRGIADALEHALREDSELDEEEVSKLINDHRAWLNKAADFRVTDAAGIVKYGLPGEAALRASYRDRHFFPVHRDNPNSGLIVSNPLFGRASHIWVIVFSRRYSHPDGRFAGVITGAVPISYFEKLLQGFNLGPKGIALLRDTDTGLISRVPPIDGPTGQIGSKTFSKELADIIASGVKAQSFRSQRTADGIERTSSYRRLTAAPFHLVIGMGADDYLAKWRDDVKQSVVIAALFMLFTAVSAGFVWHSFAMIERASKRSELLLKQASDGVHITDDKGNLMEGSESFFHMLGYTREELLGKNIQLWDRGIPSDEVGTMIETLLARPEVSKFETTHRRKDGTQFDVEVTGLAVELDGQRALYASARDITDRRAADEEIRRLAFYDSLTLLPNRRLLRDRLQQALTASARNRCAGALLFIDLDNFKALNDTLGHGMGDQLLKQVAQRLTASVRSGDTVARLGGDEFVVMLEDLKEDLTEAASQTRRIAENILATLNQPYALDSSTHHSSCSMGAALFSHRDTSVDELLKRADLAMYQAKAAGRNTLRFFDPEMQAAVTARATLEAELRQGLQAGQFLLYYQPQIDHLNRVTGAEALVRWQQPQRGLVPPAEFIALAEETGLILPLGRQVLHMACEQLVAWAQDPLTAELGLAVNVSARQFHAPGFTDQVHEVLDQTGANAQRLKLELTETVLLDDVDETICKMSNLQQRGVSFSLDDFGTGYSSLSYLKRLPLAQLKIDMSFVHDLLTDPNGATLTQTIITLAHNMGLRVIAEGVETMEQRDKLAQMRCLDYQGYLFARPMPVDKFVAYVKHTPAVSTSPLSEATH